MPRVDPDLLSAQLLSFFYSIHSESPGFLGFTSGFLIGKKLHGVTHKRFAWPADIAEAVAWVAHEASIGRDLYHDSVVYSGARRPSVKHLSSIVAEVDHRKVAALPRPTVLIESSPTLRQCYWRLEGPVGLDRARALMSRLGCGHDQLLLLPGTPNNRFSGGPHVEVLDSVDLSYTLERLEEAIPDLEGEPIASGWQPLVQVKTSERLGKAAIAAATAAGTGSLKISVAIAAAAVAITGVTSLAPDPEGGLDLAGQPPIVTTPASDRDAASALAANTGDVRLVTIAAPAPIVGSVDAGGDGSVLGLGSKLPEDSVAGSPGSGELDSDPGAVSAAISDPANQAKAAYMKAAETSVEFVET